MGIEEKSHMSPRHPVHVTALCVALAAISIAHLAFDDPIEPLALLVLAVGVLAFNALISRRRK